MKCVIKSIFIVYILLNNLTITLSLNKIPDITNNFMSKVVQAQDQRESETNLAFNYSLLIAILSVCIGFLISAIWLLFALIYHK